MIDYTARIYYILKTEIRSLEKDTGISSMLSQHIALETFLSYSFPPLFEAGGLGLVDGFQVLLHQTSKQALEIQSYSTFCLPDNMGGQPPKRAKQQNSLQRQKSTHQHVILPKDRNRQKKEKSMPEKKKFSRKIKII